MIKKIHLQVYLEDCKYRAKKTQMPRFMNTELKSDSDLDSEKIGAIVDKKLEKSGSDSE